MLYVAIGMLFWNDWSPNHCSLFIIHCYTMHLLNYVKFIPGPSSLGAKWFRYRVSIYHPLGFNWHPLEGAGFFYSFLTELVCPTRFFFPITIHLFIHPQTSFATLWLTGAAASPLLPLASVESPKDLGLSQTPFQMAMNLVGFYGDFYHGTLL